MTIAPVVIGPILPSGTPNYPDLLPGNATPLERALAGSTGRIGDIATPLRDLFRWDTCPADLLPWLAWEMSVDLWDHKWTEARKRAIVRESFELHRAKGTLYAIDRYLSYVDCNLRRAIVPPDKPFLGNRQTEAERAAWLARFPQIRIYKFRDRGAATFGAFVGAGYKLGGLFTTDQNGKPLAFPYQTNAAERYGRRAFLWDKGPHYLASGDETPLRWLERTRVENNEIVYDSEQVLIPGTKIQAVFLGGNIGNLTGRSFPVASVARTRVVTLSLPQSQTTAEDRLTTKTVGSSLAPIQAWPEKVAENGTSKLGINVFCGMRGRWLDMKTKERKRVTGFLQGYLPPTTAGERLYDRVHLHDPKRLPDIGRPGNIFIGNFRLGMPAFHARLSVEVTSKRSRFYVDRFVHGHVSDGKSSRVNAARTAVVRSMAKRDKILLKTRLHRTITTADGLLSGSGHSSSSLILDI